MQIIDKYIAQYGPGARRIGETAQSYAERILARLDYIAESVSPQQNGWVDSGLFDHFGALTAGTDFRLATLDSSEAWQLNAITRSVPLSNVIVTIDGRPRFFLSAGQVPAVAQPLILTGPGDVILQTDTNTDIALQFRRYSRAHSVRRNGGGFTNPGMEIDRNGLAEGSRHATTIVP